MADDQQQPPDPPPQDATPHPALELIPQEPPDALKVIGKRFCSVEFYEYLWALYRLGAQTVRTLAKAAGISDTKAFWAITKGWPAQELLPLRMRPIERKPGLPQLPPHYRPQVTPIDPQPIEPTVPGCRAARKVDHDVALKAYVDTRAENLKLARGGKALVLSILRELQKVWPRATFERTRLIVKSRSVNGKLVKTEETETYIPATEVVGAAEKVSAALAKLTTLEREWLPEMLEGTELGGVGEEPAVRELTAEEQDWLQHMDQHPGQLPPGWDEKDVVATAEALLAEVKRAAS